MQKVRFNRETMGQKSAILCHWITVLTIIIRFGLVTFTAHTVTVAASKKEVAEELGLGARKCAPDECEI